jgi:hypothetical protein
MAIQCRYERFWFLTRPPLQRRQLRQAITNHLECGRSDRDLRRRLVHFRLLWRGCAEIPRESSHSPPYPWRIPY